MNVSCFVVPSVTRHELAPRRVSRGEPRGLLRHASQPLNSENAMPFGDVTVNRSCAASVMPSTKINGETITVNERRDSIALGDGDDVLPRRPTSTIGAVV